MCLAMMFILAHATTAQTTLQVVTKSIEKTFSGSSVLNIEAEKADIEILTWEKSEIKVTIDLIAKHPDRKTASSDLEMLKYVADKTSREVFLRNYLVIQNEKAKPSSNLKVRYSVRIPEGMKVMIQNSFGKIYMKGSTKNLLIKADFCNIELEDLNGNIKLETHYGEIISKSFNGVAVIKSERSDLSFSNLGGKNTINAQYGKLRIESIEGLKALSIYAEKADIIFEKAPLKSFNFDVTSRFGKVNLPPNFSWTQNDKIESSAILNITLSSKIIINNSFGSITIKN
jgi:Putative adhesin